MKIKRKYFANITNLTNQTVAQIKPTIVKLIKSATGIKNGAMAKGLKFSADSIKDVTGDAVNSFLNPNKTKGTKIISYKKARRKSSNKGIQTGIDFGIITQPKPKVKQNIHANGNGSITDKIQARNKYNKLKDRAVKTTLGYNTNTVRKVVKTSGEARLFKDPLTIPGFGY